MSLTTAGRQPGRRYNFAFHGNSEQGTRQGDHLIKNNLASTWSPGFGGGPTIVRFFPAKDPGDPSGVAWDPYRLPIDEPNSFGDWIRRYPAVRAFGEPGVTMIIGDPTAHSDGIAADHFMSPAWVLYNAVHGAIKARNEGRGWAALTQGSTGRGPALSKPTDIYVAQCCIMQHKAKTYSPPYGFAPDHKPIVFAMSSSAGVSLLAELNQLKDGLAAAPICATSAECEAVYANGDPVSLDFGRFVYFYKKGEDPRRAQQPAAAGWNIQAMQTQQGQSQDKGFDCYMEPTYGGFSANLRAYEQLVASKIRRWDDILYFPTTEEQAVIIANQFPPDMIAYAWRDHPEWIPEFVRERLLNATQASVPAGVPGGVTGWPGVAPGAAPPFGGYGAPPQPPATAPAFTPGPVFAPAAAPPPPPGYNPYPQPAIPSQPPAVAPAPTSAPMFTPPAAAAPAPPPPGFNPAGYAPALTAAATPAAAPPGFAPPGFNPAGYALTPPAAAPPATPPPGYAQPGLAPPQGWAGVPLGTPPRPIAPPVDPAFAAGGGMPQQPTAFATPAPASPPPLNPDPFAPRPAVHQQGYPPQAAAPMQPQPQSQLPPAAAPAPMSRGQAALMAAQAAGVAPAQ